MHATFISQRTAVFLRTSSDIISRNSYFATLFSECSLAYFLHSRLLFHSLRFHLQLAVAVSQFSSGMRDPSALSSLRLFSFDLTHGVPVGLPWRVWDALFHSTLLMGSPLSFLACGSYAHSSSDPSVGDPHYVCSRVPIFDHHFTRIMGLRD